MVRIVVELWPRGDEQKKKVLATADIFNDCTGTATRGNYGVRLFKQGNRGHLWRRARFLNFPRKQRNVWDLLHCALRACDIQARTPTVEYPQDGDEARHAH